MSSGRSRRLLLRRTLRLLREIHGFAGRRLVAVMVLASVAALAEGVGILLLVPLLSRLGLDGAAAPFPKFELTLAGFATLAVAAGFVVAAREVAAHRLTLEFVDHLRRKLHEAVLDLDWRSYSRMRASDLSHGLTNDIDHAGGAVEFLLGLGGQLAQVVAAVVVVVALSPGLAAATVAMGLLLLRFGSRLNRRIYALGQQAGQSWQRVMAAVANDLAGFRVLKSFGGAAARRTQFAAALAELRGRDMGLHVALASNRLAARVFGVIGAVAAVALAVRGLHLSATATLAVMVAEARLIQGTGRLLSSWRTVVHALPAHARALALLRRCRRAAEPEESARLPLRLIEGLKEIALDRVTVRLDAARPPALSDVSLTLPPGELAAVVGPSGAGKTTLGDLLLGLIGPDAGLVSVDGVELTAALRPAWRRRTSVLPQDPLLFEDTVAANLRLVHPGASDDDLWRALDSAGAAGFVSALPGGLSARIGDRGVGLSGGERQRLALARALLRHPALLVLDEPTNSLDHDSELRLLATLRALRGRMTIVLITHRIDIAGRSDLIIRLDQGRSGAG